MSRIICEPITIESCKDVQKRYSDAVENKESDETIDILRNNVARCVDVLQTRSSYYCRTEKEEPVTTTAIKATRPAPVNCTYKLASTGCQADLSTIVTTNWTKTGFKQQGDLREVWSVLTPASNGGTCSYTDGQVTMTAKGCDVDCTYSDWRSLGCNIIKYDLDQKPLYYQQLTKRLIRGSPECPVVASKLQSCTPTVGSTAPIICRGILTGTSCSSDTYTSNSGKGRLQQTFTTAGTMPATDFLTKLYWAPFENLPFTGATSVSLYKNTIVVSDSRLNLWYCSNVMIYPQEWKQVHGATGAIEFNLMNETSLFFRRNDSLQYKKRDIQTTSSPEILSSRVTSGGAILTTSNAIGDTIAPTRNYYYTTESNNHRLYYIPDNFNTSVINPPYSLIEFSKLSMPDLPFTYMSVDNNGLYGQVLFIGSTNRVFYFAKIDNRSTPELRNTTTSITTGYSYTEITTRGKLKKAWLSNYSIIGIDMNDNLVFSSDIRLTTPYIIVVSSVRFASLWNDTSSSVIMVVYVTLNNQIFFTNIPKALETNLASAKKPVENGSCLFLEGMTVNTPFGCDVECKYSGEWVLDPIETCEYDNLKKKWYRKGRMNRTQGGGANCLPVKIEKVECPPKSATCSEEGIYQFSKPIQGFDSIYQLSSPSIGSKIAAQYPVSSQTCSLTDSKYSLSDLYSFGSPLKGSQARIQYQSRW